MVSEEEAPVVIVRAVQTAIAFPSQWDAWDDRGNYWYLRYRGASGSARQYAGGPDWYMQQKPGEPAPEPERALAFDRDDVGPLDGCITLEEFARLAGLVLALTDYTDWGHYMADALQQALEDGGVFIRQEGGAGAEGLD